MFPILTIQGTSSYTIPAGFYGIIKAHCHNGESVNINGVASMITDSGVFHRVHTENFAGGYLGWSNPYAVFMGVSAMTMGAPNNNISSFAIRSEQWNGGDTRNVYLWGGDTFFPINQGEEPYVYFGSNAWNEMYKANQIPFYRPVGYGDPNSFANLSARLCLQSGGGARMHSPSALYPDRRYIYGFGYNGKNTSQKGQYVLREGDTISGGRYHIELYEA